MIFNNIDDDDKKDSMYDAFEPEEPKAPKPTKYKSDDPRYWDEEEGPFEHLRINSRKRRYLIFGGAGLGLVILLWLLGIWFMGPYVQDAVQYGYVDHVEQRGNIFKTYEGKLIPYKSIHDTTRSYEGDFSFSTSDKLGKALRAFQNSGRPLRVEYRTYRYAMPWRGDSRTVIVRVDTVSVDSIMPRR